MNEFVLEIDDLSVRFPTRDGDVHALDAVSLGVHAGEFIGIVGESGCGKSTLALSMLRLVPASARLSGRIRLAGRDLLSLNRSELRAVRGRDIAFIPQDPLTSLDPTFSVGEQIVESVRAHTPMKRTDAKRRATELLESVGIADAAERMKDQPHLFSGGMRQRVLIAIALAHSPSVIVADEPTTALDVTIQAQVLALLADRARSNGTAVVLISHDLGVVQRICDRIAVMYAGKIVELGTAEDIFHEPKHPYTRALLAARPSGLHTRGALGVIPGEVPSLIGPVPAGCPFQPRCAHRMDVCAQQPPMYRVGPQVASCWLLAESNRTARTPDVIDGLPGIVGETLESRTAP